MNSFGIKKKIVFTLKKLKFLILKFKSIVYTHFLGLVAIKWHYNIAFSLFLIVILILVFILLKKI